MGNIRNANTVIGSPKDISQNTAFHRLLGKMISNPGQNSSAVQERLIMHKITVVGRGRMIHENRITLGFFGPSKTSWSCDTYTPQDSNTGNSPFMHAYMNLCIIGIPNEKAWKHSIQFLPLFWRPVQGWFNKYFSPLLCDICKQNMVREESFLRLLPPVQFQEEAWLNSVELTSETPCFQFYCYKNTYFSLKPLHSWSVITFPLQ